MNRKEIEEMAQVKQKVKDIDDNLKTHIKEQREDFNKVFVKLDELSGKFAGKWVEKVTIGTFISLITGIVILMLTGGS